MKPNVLVYGTGGRDQCLAEEYAESHHTGITFFAPGNPGIKLNKAYPNHIQQIPIQDDKELVKFSKENNIILADFGPESSLSRGIVDRFNQAGIATVGPRQEYTKIESDREFTHNLLSKINVPLPEYRVFDNPEKAKEYVKNIGYQVVVKANGLAAGKGSIVCEDEEDGFKAIDKIMIEKAFGDSGNKVIIEERKYGTEISFFAYLDGQHVLPLKMFAQDYKPAFDPDDKLNQFYFQYGKDKKGIRRGLYELKSKNKKIKIPGHPSTNENELKEILQNIELPNPNTGGTGCYCPHKLAKPQIINKIIKEIVNPTTNTIYNELGWNYKGVLYFGLNLDDYGNLDIFEINVRHGDPEAEVLLRKLQTDIFEIGMATWEGKLDTIQQKWNNNYYVDVVAMIGRTKDRPGYPKRYEKECKIIGLEKIDKQIAIFFAGVNEHNKYGPVTDGGRVLHIVGSNPNLETAINLTYNNIKKLEFLDKNNENCLRYRKTIGRD